MAPDAIGGAAPCAPVGKLPRIVVAASAERSREAASTVRRSRAESEGATRPRRAGAESGVYSLGFLSLGEETMAKRGANPKVDAILARQERWGREFARLRAIVLACGLTEEVKWGQPCYAYDGRNIVLIHGFRDYCALLFFKGALMKDPDGLLIQQTENVQAGRQIRFEGLGDVAAKAAALKAYVEEAIAVEKAGLQVAKKTTAEFAMPDEFRKRLAADKALKSAFVALTPGRQRAYLLHFGDAKQSKTREARIEKHELRILAGKGLDD